MILFTEIEYVSTSSRPHLQDATGSTNGTHVFIPFNIRNTQLSDLKGYVLIWASNSSKIINSI